MTWRDLFPARDPQQSGNGAVSKPTPPLDWAACVSALKAEGLDRLGNERWYSRRFCSWLHEKKIVGLYNGCFAFPVHDEAGNVVAVHYRTSNGWRYCPRGAKLRPLVLGELLAGDAIHVFESQWDAFAFMDKSGEYNGIIVTRGASNGALAAAVIPKDARVYSWEQSDAPAQMLTSGICANTKALVKRVKIPAPYKDLNDWTKAGATSCDLLDVMLKAEVVRDREKSWTEALNESVVTSSELRDLNLVPRKKLFADWFCEGDMGFIFAFRGVGKTWLALGIAQALSTGGKLGDWSAHEPVRVLYVDGEMPPDLMRTRSGGLEAANDNLHFLSHDILFERTGKVLNITKPEVQQAITQRCLASAIKILFLDNLSTLACGMKENEADSWELVNNWLLDLRRRKIAVVIVHHAGRSGEMRGTSKREDNVFWIIALDDAKENNDDKRGARFISRFTKPSRNTQEEIPAYEWHFVTQDSGIVTVSCKLAQTMDVFLGLIEDGVTECGHIAQKMKASPATVSRLAKKAIDAGKIIKVNREYMLAEAEKAKK